MKKRKRIHKQLEKIYLKNSKQLSKADRLLFKLLIVKLGNSKKAVLVVFIVKLLKGLIALIFADSRPGSFLLCYDFKIQYEQSWI
jgi:N-glycosylase/DNA lyase